MSTSGWKQEEIPVSVMGWYSDLLFLKCTHWHQQSHCLFKRGTRGSNGDHKVNSFLFCVWKVHGEEGMHTLTCANKQLSTKLRLCYGLLAGQRPALWPCMLRQCVACLDLKSPKRDSHVKGNEDTVCCLGAAVWLTCIYILRP